MFNLINSASMRNTFLFYLAIAVCFFLFIFLFQRDFFVFIYIYFNYCIFLKLYRHIYVLKCMFSCADIILWFVAIIIIIIIQFCGRFYLFCIFRVLFIWRIPIRLSLLPASMSQSTYTKTVQHRNFYMLPAENLMSQDKSFSL